MSRHYCDTVQGSPTVRVTVGYDRPLNYFHLTVERTSDAKSDDTTDGDDDTFLIYSNVADPKLAGGKCDDLEYYRAKLRELGIDVPDSMFSETELDAINRVGNRTVCHGQDGSTESTPASFHRK